MDRRKYFEPWTDWRPKLKVPLWVIVLMYASVVIMFGVLYGQT